MREISGTDVSLRDARRSKEKKRKKEIQFELLFPLFLFFLLAQDRGYLYENS
jgi:hypothetical protein